MEAYVGRQYLKVTKKLVHENLDALIWLRIGWPGVVKTVMDFGVQKMRKFFYK